jgi:hypothetical protein
MVTVTVPPAIPSTEPSYSKIEQFTSAMLNSTNTYRTQHNASDVKWNDTLADFAEDYLAENDDCEFEHSGGPYGENIAIGYANASAAVEAWGDEREEYDFDEGEFSKETGHFTQMVWKNTSAVGCGRRLCGERGWFLACEYWPRGNVIGLFVDEVQERVDSAGWKMHHQTLGVFASCMVSLVGMTLIGR